MRIVSIKLKSAGPNMGPFTISDNYGNLLAENVPRTTLKNGISYNVNDDVSVIVICSSGRVKLCKNFSILDFDIYEYIDTEFTDTGTSCAWTHLKDPTIYNTYYGNIEPYVIEYPFSYKYLDEIARNVKDYTKVYKYIPTLDTVLADYSKVELDNVWFNKAILYNGQQNSGLLNLEFKPVNNLAGYMSYPKLNEDSKTILVTKSDNFYQYNSFWNVIKDKTVTQFSRSCESLSIDKQLNQSNMDYTKRTRKKDMLRAKELKIRHILDNKGDTKLVSQFIVAPTQNSFK